MSFSAHVLRRRSLDRRLSKNRLETHAGPSSKPMGGPPARIAEKKTRTRVLGATPISTRFPQAL